jgi:glycosyltransferase involved in cell wall biosynthesis
LYRADDQGWAGGAELQAHYLARALAARGLRVAHIVGDDLALPRRQDGVDLVQQVARTGGPKGTRSARATWDALVHADASVYIQRSAGATTGVVAAFARANRRRFVYSLSSTADLEGGLLSAPEAAVMGLGLRLADRVVTQTAEQQGVAQRRLGVKATLVRSFCEPRSVPHRPELFLWIGGLIDYKNPLAYLDVAELVPQARFLMVATARPGWEGLAVRVRARAEGLANVTLAGPRPRSELLALYARAIAVVGTSTFEGFPNTFLEAWACGVPVLSLKVDPDGVIERNGLGAVAGGSVERLAEFVRAYASGHVPDPAAATEYVRREHDPSVIGDAWLEVIRGLMDRS